MNGDDEKQPSLNILSSNVKMRFVAVLQRKAVEAQIISWDFFLKVKFAPKNPCMCLGCHTPTKFKTHTF